MMFLTPMKLRCWAAKSLCIRLVYEWANSDMPVLDIAWKNENGYGTCLNHDVLIWHMYEMRIPPTMTIPKLIHEQIDENIASIVDQVKDWIRYHHSKHFFHDEPSSPLNEYLLGLVWNADRSIDYTASARNILTNMNLTPMEIFRFACTYCFVDEITNLRDLADVACVWDFEYEPFLVYWSKRLKNELDTISLPENVTIDVLMLEKALKDCDLWSPIEYFFSKLDTAEKFRQFNNVANHCGIKYRNELLSKFDHEEWNLVYRKSIAKMVLNCARSGNFEEIRRILGRFNGTMNSKNFCIIVRELVPLSMTNRRNFNALTPLLMEMWADARDEIKKSAIKDELLRHIGDKCADLIDDDDVKFDFESRREYIEPLRFFRALLKSCDREQTEAFIGRNFYWLVLWQPLAAVKKLLQEGLVDSRCLTLLKKQWKHSFGLRRTCWTLLRFGEFDEFNNVVWFCWLDDCIDIDMNGINNSVSVEDVSFSQANIAFDRATIDRLSKYADVRERYIALHYENIALRDRCIALLNKHIALCEESVALYKVCVVKSVGGLSSLSCYLCRYDWRRLNDFLRNSIFSRNDSEADSLMRLLFQSRFIETDFLKIKLCRAELNDVKDFLSTSMSRYFGISLLKYTCYDVFFRCLFDESEDLIFKRGDTQDFLAWCCNSSESATKRFKNASLFPKGFLGQLKGCVCDRMFKASDSMEAFLEWCFPSQMDRRQFKRDLIYRYREYRPIEDLLRQRKYRRWALNWFFDNDVELIEKFKANELTSSTN